MDEHTTKIIRKFISPISEAELICRMLEAGAQIIRPEGQTAEEVFNSLDPEDQAIWRRAAKAAMDYWRDCITVELRRERRPRRLRRGGEVMDDENIPTAIAEGTLDIFGITIRCVVLDNGKRVIPTEDMHALMEMLERQPITQEDADRIARFVKGQQA